LAAGPSSYGQRQQFFLTVIDKKSNEPVAYANVQVEGIKSKIQKHYVTSIEGVFPNEVPERSTVIISCVGFETFHDTIIPGKSMTLLMKPTVFNMSEVVVTGQYSPERVDKSIYKIEVISSKQIEQKAANTMAELLNGQVNMRVTQTGVLGTSLSMQGLSGENVKFLVDGVPMIGRMDGNIDLNTIALFNVDHVEIIEGPMSVIYGSNALAGVVNIITKENKSNRFNTFTNAYTESVDVFNFNGGISANLRNHGLAFNGGRNFFGGYSVPSMDSGRAQTYKPSRQYFFDGYYAFNRNNFRIKFAGQYFNELLEDKGNLLPPYYETAFDSYFTTIRYTGRVESSLKLNKSNYLNFMAAYSGYRRIKEKFYNDLTTLTEVKTTNPDDQDTTGITSWTARATYSKNDQEKKFNYQAGLDLNIETGSGKRILDYEQQIGDYAAFGSLNWKPVRQLSIQPGVRFIYNTKFSAPVVYALSAKWAFNDRLSLRLSYSKGFRSPALKELYLYFVDVNHNVQGNPDLGSETSNNFNLNLVFSKERKRIAWGSEISGFFNHVNNIITLAQMSTADNLYTYINVDQYNAVSGQLGLSFRYYPSLTIQAGISETGRNYYFDEQNKSSKFYFSTDLTSSISYHFIAPEIILALIYKYTGKTPQFIFGEGSISEAYVDPYNTLDFTASKGFMENLIKISTGVKNIFDVTAIPAVGMSGGAHSGGGDAQAIGWGRTIFLKLSINFNKTK